MEPARAADADGPHHRVAQSGRAPHQDNSVVTEDADDTEIITVLFPLTEATLENGCLAVVPRSAEQGLLTHCPERPWLHIPPLFR